MIYLLSHVIRQAVAHSPHHEAFRCRGESLTYVQLDKRSDDLAGALQSAGVECGDRVAIYMQKSLYVPIAVYACLKAGAIYVPVDPALPRERLVFLLNDAGVAAILTAGRHEDNLSSLSGELVRPVRLVVGTHPAAGVECSSLTWNTIPGNSQYCDPRIVEDDPAYIIYTSGSTGAPKGILHTHRSGLAYARLAKETYHVCNTDRLGNFAPLHFDQSTFDIFAGPLAGATTVMIPEEYTRFPASLARLIDDECLTIWYSVPYALVQLLLRGGVEERDLSSLRWVLYGGEPFPIPQLRTLMQRLPKARFSNVYGPAEVNQCTFYHLSCPPEVTDSAVPIGRIWENTDGLIVDDAGASVSPGEIGELLIRSATMMAGYWNRPDLNQSAFHVVKRGGVSSRYYRTGDLVRQAADGNLEFHGRKDRQVKIRGHRVELDEVEAVFRSVAGIQDAAAFTTDDPIAGDKQIVLAAISTVPLSNDQLRQNAIQRLPSYSVPAQFHSLKEFPLTTTGKIDYRTLLQMVSGRGGAP